MEKQVYSILGLNSAEIKTYEILLKIGTSTTGIICKESEVPSSHIYNILNSLIKKGLVNYHITKNTKYFQAANPSILLQLYKDKQKELNDYETKIKEQVSNLILSSAKKEKGNDIRIYEGYSSIKRSIQNVFNILKKNETYYVLGAPEVGNEKLNAFYKEVHKSRIKKGIKLKIIYNKSAEKFARQRKKLPLTEVKIQNIDTPVELCIYNENIQVIIFSNKIILLEIKSEEIANSFLQYFNILWKNSKNI